MFHSLWKSLSSWGDLPANFPYVLGPAVPYGFELPGGFVQFFATIAKPGGGCSAEHDGSRHPILGSLLNPSNGVQVSVFAFKRDKQQLPHFHGSTSVSQHRYDQAKNHLVKCKTLLHPNLLKVLGTYETSNALYVVTECCFSLAHVLYLSQQQQQQQNLAAKRPPTLPRQQSDNAIKKLSGDLSDGACYEAAAAAAAAATAGNSCWNFLELIGGLSFLHDQCKLVHGEVSPFSVFVTPHGKWKLSCFGLSRPLESVRWPDFYSQVVASASTAQGWLPPRPSPGARPDAVDRWGLCSIFAWWRENQRDPYSAARFAGACATGDARIGFSIGLDETSFQKELQRLPTSLQRVMQKILDPKPNSIPLSRLSNGEDECFSGDACCKLLTFIRALPVKSNVDKEAFFEQELPALIQQRQMIPAIALHLLLPELALLFMNSSASMYHCSILKSILSIVTSVSNPSGQPHGNDSNAKAGSIEMPLRLFSEVLAHAFDSPDRALRFVLLSQLPAVQHLLHDSFFVQTWEPLILGLEDSAPAIRACTSRVLALYASRRPLDAHSLSSVFTLLEQRLRDVAGGVRLEAVVASAATARDCSERGGRRCPEVLANILCASLKDPEDSVRIAGLQASAHCADLLTLPGLVNLLVAASSCFLSSSPAVVASTSDCIHLLANAAKTIAEEQQRQQNRLEGGASALANDIANQNGKMPEGWITTVRSLSAALGLGKRGSNSAAFLARKSSNSYSSSALGQREVYRSTVALKPPPPDHTSEPSQPQPPAAPRSPPPPSRTADEFEDARGPVSSWVDDSDITADAWEATPEIDALASHPNASVDSAPLHRIVGNNAESQLNRAGPVPNTVGGSSSVPLSSKNNEESFRQPPKSPCSAAPFTTGGSTSSMRLQAPGSSLLTTMSLVAASERLATTVAGTQTSAVKATDSEDFFASLEREAAERNL